ncbi:hypothetical protein SAMN05216207_106018 [Pseudonocardia ammonioxydans]|uniref:Cholesterol esterase n=1 Tax=Pseudonocardia ammonioxydans TaxID=260086 RepID=A0A1I5H9E9_PSUAM|nr:DUF6230 family protein [Pseudonocardia ammonioxydans]SFO44912.1 hypothetical protein SAMN05216207_106018 [Pseudonocardia ammonioxydans]
MDVDPRSWPEVTRHRKKPPGREGWVSWRRLVLVLTPATLSIGAMAVGALTGAVPVALALEGQQTLKISAQRFNGEAFGALPSFVQNPDGSRQPVVVLDLRRVRVAGLCASTAVDTPAGRYVLRATTPTDRDVTAGRLQLAIESIDGLGAAGQQLGLNREQTAPDGTPIDTSTGGVPATIDGLVLDVSATARWATVNQLQLAGAEVRVGSDQPECL